MEEISVDIKKTILNLQFTKYLQFFNTSIIILFTFFIGTLIALLTKQIKLSDQIQIKFFIITGIILFTPLILLIQKFKFHMQNILNEIKKLNRKL
jgi:hypothetical protein